MNYRAAGDLGTIFPKELEKYWPPTPAAFEVGRNLACSQGPVGTSEAERTLVLTRIHVCGGPSEADVQSPKSGPTQARELALSLVLEAMESQGYPAKHGKPVL
jgi:hypothetical protein